MRYLSLFSGIGGFELGIQKVYESNNTIQQEQDGPPRRRHSFSDGIESDRQFNELQTPPTCIGFSEIDKYASQIYQKHFPNHKNYGDITKIKAEDLPEFDLIVGGFPCQSFSIAGKRGGFADTRGTLFFEIARILKAKQPRLLLLENVKGLLSHDEGRTFATIIATLDELGYDLQWQVLNSKNFGVPQNRERVFIVGHLRGTSRPEVFPIEQGSSGNLKYSGGVISYRQRWLEDGNAYSRNFSQGQRIYSTDGISQTLAGNAGGQGGKTGLYETEEMKIRRLTPTECERLQGFPDGWTEGVSDTQRYKCLGNAVTVNVIQHLISLLSHIYYQ
jgi:DNA (cytosine-5)-methyltransferase 1